ncbi:MAG: hypothetical protein ABSC63_01730 [Candidatus Binataceae bacterium]|jgi:Flp pilus assembly protein TadD
MIRMSLNSTPRSLTIAGALFLTATLGTLTLGGNARAASVAGVPAERASALRAECATAANALPFAAVAHRTLPIVVAHLDEESVPAAENPGAPVLDGSAPETNPGPSADWERIPATGAPPPRSSAEFAPVAPAAHAPPATAAIPDNAAAAAAAPATGGNRAARPRAQTATVAPGPTVASVQPATAPAAGNAAAAPVTGSSETGGTGEQPADVGPPPALDLGTMQSGPDLSSISLAGEIKKAETPARMAALRVTEQARMELAAGKTDDALRDLGRAVSIDPGNPFEYVYLGRAYVARRNYAQALTFFKRAEIGFGVRPDWLGETVGFEGACYEELGQMTDAALAYRRALGSAQGNLRARVGYSRLSGYLPSVATAADASPAAEALPPPERTAAGPAPAEGPPPPPPAPDSTGTRMPGADYQPD